ncbi:ninjurin-1 isoform X1 [Gorilla gorilla gorilla]|uniref:ninjurin-1 isoform X1 n=1 Tax=Gorilla gorilla gorilla TaxID=9595 RepID=UPI00123E928E|nr:ninjurin-1 isoform X1 [Gorilla gorilla gorilla]
MPGWIPCPPLPVALRHPGLPACIFHESGNRISQRGPQEVGCQQWVLTAASKQPARWGWRHGPINVNHYANKKSAAESMLDIALLMANASQLKAVVEQGPSFAFYVPLVVLISISLALQISVGVLLIFLVKYDLNNPAKHAKLDFLNNLATGLVFIIVVVNIFITAFGVQKPLMDMAPQQ